VTGTSSDHLDGSWSLTFCKTDTSHLQLYQFGIYSQLSFPGFTVRQRHIKTSYDSRKSGWQRPYAWYANNGATGIQHVSIADQCGVFPPVLLCDWL